MLWGYLPLRGKVRERERDLLAHWSIGVFPGSLAVCWGGLQEAQDQDGEGGDGGINRDGREVCKSVYPLI